MAWIEIPEKYLMKNNGIQKVSVTGLTFCLVFNEDRWIAFSRKCPHAGAPLDQGWCDDGMIVCPYHRQRFDLTTGKGAEGQGNYITIYPVAYIEGKWCIQVKPTFMQRLFSRS